MAKEPFTIYVVQSSHTDIGYTHPQEQIAAMYLEQYDRVLELCRRSAGAPEESRFKWTCETAWQVRHYLAARPEREEEFLRHARSGQIELTAAYLHFTDLVDADAYRRSLEWAVAYARRHALPLRCALHCDINGWPWAVADLLAEQGIPYFCSQVHIDSATDPLGRRGSVHYQWTLEQGAALRPDVPVRTPQAFWWEGPAGGRVLHWLGEHYLLGNVLGISSPQGFHADKTRYFAETDRLTAGELYAHAAREVPCYVDRLRADGYSLDALMLSTGGYYVDNAPPDDRWCAVIARWNKEHADIRLRTATLGEWFEALASRDASDWPTYRTAWPDHWAHGLGAFTARVAQARQTQRRRPGVRALIAANATQPADAALVMSLEQELFALEHTFDAWCTTAWPSAPTNAFQQAAKELTFHRAALYLDEAAQASLRAARQTEFHPRLYLYGEHPGPLGSVAFEAGDQRLEPANQLLVAEDGERFAFQRDSDELAQFVAVLPARAGLAGYTLVAQAEEPPSQSSTRAPRAPTRVDDVAEGGDEPGPAPGPARRGAPAASRLESDGWELRVDPQTGGLSGLRERATGREWVDPDQAWAFGQLVHEAVVHPLGRAAVGNTARLIALDVASEGLRRSFAAGPIVEHTVPFLHGVPRLVAGPVFDAIEMQGEGGRIGRLRIAWRLYHALPLVELVLDWDKRWSDLPEAAYVAFPIAAAGGDLLLETGGGFFRPGSHAADGQLPGTCSSYYTIQRAARLTASDGAALLWLPLDAPLVMPNRIDYNNWETGEWAWNGFLASMPVNHYCHTNFPTSQRGPLRLRYRLAAGGRWSDNEEAIRAALPAQALGWR